MARDATSRPTDLEARKSGERGLPMRINGRASSARKSRRALEHLVRENGASSRISILHLDGGKILLAARHYSSWRRHERYSRTRSRYSPPRLLLLARDYRRPSEKYPLRLAHDMPATRLQGPDTRARLSGCSKHAASQAIGRRCGTGFAGSRTAAHVQAWQPSDDLSSFGLRSVDDRFMRRTFETPRYC